MSDSHDQSYYEIALTNRQVMSIFVVLLVCVLISFLGGVWLGKDADAKVEMASTQAIVAGEAQDAPLEPLDFFNRPTAAEKTGATAGEASSVPDPAGARARSSDQTAPSPTGGEKVAAPETGRKARDEPKRKPANRDSAPATGDGAAEASSVVIQVFSSNEEAQALRVADQLRKSGYPAILSPVEVAGRTLHRVRLGPYSDSDEARVVAESVRRAFKFDTWITH